MAVSRRQLLAGAGLLPFAAIAAPVSAAEKKVHLRSPGKAALTFRKKYA